MSSPSSHSDATLCEEGRSVRSTTSFCVDRLPDRAWPWLLECPVAVDSGAYPWMVIFVAACRGAVFTVDDEEWSGVVDTLETTEETIERSTGPTQLAKNSTRLKQKPAHWQTHSYLAMHQALELVR